LTGSPVPGRRAETGAFSCPGAVVKIARFRFKPCWEQRPEYEQGRKTPPAHRGGASSLCDGPAYARNVEAAFRDMWAAKKAK